MYVSFNSMRYLMVLGFFFSMKFLKRKIWHGRIYWNPRVSLTFLRVYDTWLKMQALASEVRFTVPFKFQICLLKSEDFFDDGHDLLARVRHVALVENASVGLRFTPFQF